MALQQREICKVGESPTQGRRSLSPRRRPSTPCTTPEKTTPGGSPVAETSPGHSSPEIVRSPSRTKVRLLQGKPESPVKALGKSPKHANWKTSKFFSRSMASGELLKGFKKLSTTTAPASTANAEAGGGGAGGEESEGGANKESEKESESSRSFKSRFSSLRRKSGSDSDSVPKVDSETLKLGSQDVRGIVCKKEDLISLMQVPVAPCVKDRRLSSPAELIVPVVTSTLPTSPVPVLKSPSLKVAPNSPFRGSFRQTRSSSLDPTHLPTRPLPPPALRVPPPSVRTVVHPPPSLRKVSDDICLKKTSGAFLEVVPEVKRRLSGPLIEVRDRIPEEVGEEGGEGEVQWDEANFVDPNLLGGAIEAFLKGMGTSPTPTPTTDKRVSFKKSLIK